jgi:hypothetical protein
MIGYDGNTLTIDGKSYDLEHRIVDAVECQGGVAVLFDPAAYTAKFGQFANLVGLSCEGAKLWTAELPSTTSGDRYYKLVRDDKLRAASVYSFICDIDPRTGRIIRKEFLK